MFDIQTGEGDGLTRDEVRSRLNQVTNWFERTHLYAMTEAMAQELQGRWRVPVNLWSERSADPARQHLPYDSIDAHRKVALLFTSVWGRVGSSVIYDCQTRYLASRGFLVVRILVDQWPDHDGRTVRLPDLVHSELKEACPFLAFVAERDTDPIRTAAVHDLSEFRNASPVRRIQTLLGKPQISANGHLARIAQTAEIAVINHVTLVEFAKNLVTCPIVLETQDIFSDLLDLHGVPGFVPPGPDSPELRREEERKTWRSVAACVNLTLADHQEISKTAPQSFLIRPYIPRVEPIPEHAQDTDIDILLWGSNHGGNLAGIGWFLDEVVPISPALGEAIIAVAGGVSTQPELGRRQNENVRLLGVMPSMDACFRRAKVVVVADQGGSGLSIKLMDAASRGLCVATSTAGARDLDVAELGFEPSSTAREMADDIEVLLKSEPAREERAKAARQLYLNNFSADAYASGWDAVLTSIAPASPSVMAVTRSAAEISTRSLRLSVVICTYNRYELLTKSIQSVLEQDLDDIEIIVVDNSDDQHAAERFAANYASVAKISYLIEPSPGLSRARNIGTRACRSDLVAFIDDDAIAQPEWARKLVEAFEAVPGQVGAVGGPVSPLWPVEKPDWIVGELYGFLSLVNIGAQVRPLEKHEWIAGCNMAFRRSSLEAAGGFSEGLGRVSDGHVLMANEELDVMMELRARGQQIVYTPFAEVHHYVHPSRLNESWFCKRAAWQAVSDFLTPSAAGVHLHVLNAPQRLYESSERRGDTPLDRIASVYDIVAVCLAGEYRHHLRPPDMGSAAKPRKSRFKRNVKSLPRKTVEKLRRLLSGNRL